MAERTTSSQWIDYSSDEEDEGIHADESTPYEYKAPEANSQNKEDRNESTKQSLAQDVKSNETGPYAFFLSNLSFKLTIEELRDFFGNLIGTDDFIARLIMLKGENKPAGKAILQVKDMEAALVVVEQVGNELGGRRLMIRTGRPDVDRNNRGGGRGDRGGRGRRGRREPRSQGFDVLRQEAVLPTSEPNSPIKPPKIERAQSSPFGAAKPVDTAAKAAEFEIAEIQESPKKNSPKKDSPQRPAIVPEPIEEEPPMPVRKVSAWGNADKTKELFKAAIDKPVITRPLKAIPASVSAPIETSPPQQTSVYRGSTNGRGRRGGNRSSGRNRN